MDQKMMMEHKEKKSWNVKLTDNSLVPHVGIIKTSQAFRNYVNEGLITP